MAARPAARLGQPVPRAITLTMILATAAGLWFIKPYLGAILLSVLIAYAFNPVYKFLRHRLRNDWAALGGTLATVILVAILPCALILAAVAVQVNALINEFQSGNVQLGSAQIEQVVDQSIARVNRLLEGPPVRGAVSISHDSVMNGLREAGTRLLGALANAAQGAGTAALGLISTTILAVFLVMAMWRHQHKLVSLLSRLSPFDGSVNRLYYARASAMTHAMIKGQLLIALAQGVASTFSLWVAGVDYLWFLLVLLTFLSFIPLGAGVVTIPIGLILLATGNIWQGLFVIVFHLLVVTTIDNFMRPALVPRQARLNTALTLLSVFSGIALFGALGVIYGPVVMILLVTTFEMYAAYNERRERPGLAGDAE